MPINTMARPVRKVAIKSERSIWSLKVTPAAGRVVLAPATWPVGDGVGVGAGVVLAPATWPPPPPVVPPLPEVADGSS